MKGKEKLLKIEKTEISHILESIPDAFISLGYNWCITFINKAAEDILGHNRGELLGKDIREIYDDSDAKRICTKFHKAITEGLTVSFEEYYEPCNMWIDVRVFPSDEGISIILRDISAKKSAEQELEDIRRDLSHAQAVAKTGSWRLLVRHNKLLWSDETYRIFGIPKGTEMTYDIFLSSIHPEDREFVDVKWREALQTGKYDIEHRIIADGAVKWVNEKAELEFELDGSLKGGFGTVQDITERKKAEEKLSEQKEELKLSEERFRTLASATFEGIVISENGYVIEANEQFAKMHGYELSEVIGKHISEFQHPDAVDFVTEKINSGTEHIGEFKNICKDGSEMIVESHGRTIYYSGRKLRIATIRDITERKKSEQVLQATVERFFTVLSSMYTGILLIREDNIVEFANQAFCDIYGFKDPPEKLRGVTSEEIIERVKNSYFDSDEAVARILEILRMALPVKGEEVKLNGQTTCIRDFIPLNVNGKSYGRLWHHVDITERKKSEEALKNAVEALKRSNTDLEQFAYVASHDLQEPLRMLSYFSKLLANKYKDSLDSKGDEYIDFIIDSAKRMQALISDLLSYSRVTSRPSPSVPTDLNIVINEILKDLQLIISETDANVTCSSMPTVKVDPVQIKQVFQNLIINAIKFRKNGRPEVQICSERKADKWIFSVKDNGIGIDPQYFDKVFVIFQRLHNKEQYPGTGIGLAICKKIVERHGGRIWVESKAGKGADFYFTLPLAGHS